VPTENSMGQLTFLAQKHAAFGGTVVTSQAMALGIAVLSPAPLPLERRFSRDGAESATLERPFLLLIYASGLPALNDLETFLF